MSPADGARKGWAWARRFWSRWQMTIVIIWITCVSIAVVGVNYVQNQRRVDQACQSVTQVKDAAVKLTLPTSEAGVTDPNTLERIRVSNAAKAEARRQLEQGLACR